MTILITGAPSNVVFLSIQGADRNRAVPHRAVKDHLRASPIAWTFVRAASFMQNLSTTHAPEIREAGEIWVPAGRGRLLPERWSIRRGPSVSEAACGRCCSRRSSPLEQGQQFPSSRAIRPYRRPDPAQTLDLELGGRERP
jgi:hypothetical protein